MNISKDIKDLIKVKVDISKLKKKGDYNNSCIASITNLKVKELTK